MKFPKILLGAATLPFLFGFTNIAHRGDNEAGQYSEHSFQAYDRAIAQRADYIEMDIHRTADGVLVVSHDNNMSKIFGANINITESKYADLVKYHNHAGEPIHTLKEVFDRYKNNPNVKFMIETKNETSPTGMEQQLVNLINSYGLQNRVLFESFSEPSLKVLSQIAPNIPRTLLGRNYRDIGNNQYFASYYYNPTISEYLKAHGKKYLVWGADSEEAMRKLVEQGNIEGIITNFPGRLSQVLGVTSYPAQDIQGKIIIKYRKNGAVNVWNGYGKSAKFSGQRVKDGTEHAVSQVAIQNGKTWYNLGNNHWIDGQYVAFYASANKAGQAPVQRKGVLKIKYRPGYSVNMWNNPNGTHFSGRRLKHGTSWKYYATAQSNGHTFYNLGANQWVDGHYVTVIR
ncbi:glycerophosphodiester phosphodiesterase [uncultured Lactobacillus sp.]|uniref:glycerophosphodiester phosphodiesterase n=1 Tax=uncultured Lactobacillus sp. TaxID=153152 RepID=UPI0026204F03|nr:glycerophosphodiester phosphodiesterase [uncultured Lactobacillus sp.]